MIKCTAHRICTGLDVGRNSGSSSHSEEFRDESEGEHGSLLSSQAHFVMCLVERWFILKLNSGRLILASTNFKQNPW